MPRLVRVIPHSPLPRPWNPFPSRPSSTLPEIYCHNPKCKKSRTAVTQKKRHLLYCHCLKGQKSYGPWRVAVIIHDVKPSSYDSFTNRGVFVVTIIVTSVVVIFCCRYIRNGASHPAGVSKRRFFFTVLIQFLFLKVTQRTFSKGRGLKCTRVSSSTVL